jgi:ZIP family zinc transporter
MNTLLIILFCSWLAGLSATAGAILASLEEYEEGNLKNELIHGITAFGGGILIAAVAFTLVPEGIKNLSVYSLAVVFIAGGIVFCFLDEYITKNTGNMAQLMAMILDFVPEAVALGAVFGQNKKLGYMLVLFIGAQNLPEGFNSLRELKKSGITYKKSISAIFSISFLGPLSAAAGYLFLQDSIKITSGIMCFAAGGILYLIFQDIAPEAVFKRRWTPPLGAVSGFALGMIAHKLII